MDLGHPSFPGREEKSHHTEQATLKSGGSVASLH